MNPDALVEAFNLPDKARVRRWIQKKALSEQVTGTQDRRLIEAGIERLDWLATLSPATIGVAAQSGEADVVSEIQLLALTARKEPSRRLLDVIHRAIPYPVVLASTWPGGAMPRLSLLARHHAIVLAFALDLDPTPASRAFLASLDLAGLPRTGLAALYDGIVERAEALWAARVSGGAFRLAQGVEEVERRSKAIDAYRIAEIFWRSKRSTAKIEKRLAHAVALGEEVRQAKAAMDVAAAALR